MYGHILQIKVDWDNQGGTSPISKTDLHLNSAKTRPPFPVFLQGLGGGGGAQVTRRFLVLVKLIIVACMQSIHNAVIF